MKILFAILLVAFALCLSACGNNKDSAAASSKDSVKQLVASQIQETSPSADAPENGADVDVPSESSVDKGRQSVVSDSAGEQENDPVDSGTPLRERASSQKSADSGLQNSGNAASRSGDSQTYEQEAASSAAVPQGPGEIDNAEVNINDL